MRMFKFSKFGLAAAALMVLATGCQERPPRSFVQPNVLKKSDLEGTWYYLQTVTEAPVTSTFLFQGFNSGLMKVKFDIQENTLFARRAYEQIENSEDAHAKNAGGYYGQPLAAWPIQSQFDIIRDYNPTTGEETNRIIESTERPWNEREFIRVNWADNSLTTENLSGLGINFFIDDWAKIQPASYWESDPTKDDSFHMERADESDADEFAAGEANYFDITNKWVISPEQTTISFEQNGQTSSVTWPTCYLSYKIQDCTSQVYKVRHAFAKVSPKHDYEPRKWDGLQMDLFGFFETGNSRLTYNRQYGVTNSGLKRYMERFNVWKKSYEADGKTPIPYERREQRTIPYYFTSSTGEFPKDLFPESVEVVRQWNEAIKVAVADVAQKPIEQVKDVFVSCHNPVKLVADADGPADNEACKANLKPQRDAKGELVLDANGNPIYAIRYGDPRRAIIHWVNEFQAGGPLGYGPTNADPETGESIGAMANIYGGALDTYVTRSRDLIKLLTGQISQTEFIEGYDVKGFVDRVRNGTMDRHETIANEDVQKLASSIDLTRFRGGAPEARIDQKNGMKAFLQSIKNRENALFRNGLLSDGSSADLGQIRRNKLRGTQLEAMMVTPDIMAMAGATGGDFNALSEVEKARVSPLRSEAVRKRIEDRLNKMRAFGVDFADFADEGLIQRAIKYARDPEVPNMDDEVIRKKLRKEIFLGVTLHEVGHNVGLRHNFRASWDALNYFDEYWKLREHAARTGGGGRFLGYDFANNQPQAAAYAADNSTECLYPARDANAGFGGPPAAGQMRTRNYTAVQASEVLFRPRYKNCRGGATSVHEIMGIADNNEQLKVGIREAQYSSIMDYGAEFNSDLMGLGKYDKAAMKFGYAGDGYVEVFTDADTSGQNQLKWNYLHYFQRAFGYPSPLYQNGANDPLLTINYTEYPKLFKGATMKDKVANMAKRVDVPFRDIAGYTFDPETGRLSADEFALRTDSEGRIMVPYYFCSDEFANNLTCRRFDSGADVYEQLTDVISRYENFYLLNNFKRDRWTFYSSLAYRSRIADRYFDYLHAAMTWYTLIRTGFEGELDNLDKFYADEDLWGSFTVGVTKGFDAFGAILAKPQAGTYTLVSRTANNEYEYDVYRQTRDDIAADPLRPAGGPIVGLIDGKYLDTTWDFNGCGYFWGDECQTRIGYFVDKTIALDFLTQSQAYFTGRDTTTDVRKYAIGYITGFKNQMLEKFGAILSGDLNAWAPRGTTATGGKMNLKYRSWTTDPTVPSDMSGTIVDPASGFTLQLYAGLYALSSLPTTFDLDVVDNSKIFVVGNGEAPVPDSDILANGFILNGTNTPPLTANWVIFTDPETNKTYAARTTAPQQSRRLDIAARMLETYAKAVRARTTACASPSSTECFAKGQAVRNFKANLDVMRSLHHAFGYGSYRTDAPFAY
jgi:hypothetical protein